MPTVKKKKTIPIHQRSWNELTPRQKNKRVKSLDVITQSKNTKKSLSVIAKEKGISFRTVQNHTNAFKKENGKWIPKRFDRISRMLVINENGKAKSIEVKDSRVSSVIGSYHNAVKTYLDTGNPKSLKKFSKKRIKDVNGKSHKFETNLQKIIEIEEKVESRELREIYGDGN
ncbi:MAG: hypothetical protein ACW9W4_05650 [Candidatus Nitrosopumilus sp. bin_7KS]